MLCTEIIQYVSSPRGFIGLCFLELQNVMDLKGVMTRMTRSESWRHGRGSESELTRTRRSVRRDDSTRMTRTARGQVARHGQASGAGGAGGGGAGGAGGVRAAPPPPPPPQLLPPLQLWMLLPPLLRRLLLPPPTPQLLLCCVCLPPPPPPPPNAVDWAHLGPRAAAHVSCLLGKYFMWYTNSFLIFIVIL